MRTVWLAVVVRNQFLAAIIDQMHDSYVRTYRWRTIRFSASTVLTDPGCSVSGRERDDRRWESLGSGRQVNLASYPDAKRAAAVSVFDARFGEMERVLWCLSVNAHAGLLAGVHSPIPEALVWTIKSWWGVQGVRSATKTRMAHALESMTWSPDLFGPVPGNGPDPARHAYDCVTELVNRSMSLGVPRREYSLASKVLHWLMPWRVPVYDSFVRGALDVPASWDHPQAYRKVTGEIFAMTQTMSGNLDWIGPLEPRSPLRALDKLIWWVGGGSTGTATEVRDPQHILCELGLPCH